jgi:1-phosphofructokinase
LITTLTLNPCIDRTITIAGFKYGGLNRVVHTRSDFSGKGINVSIAVRQLGGQTEVLGFNYLGSQDFVQTSLKQNDIKYQFINIDGTLRTNIKIFDDESHVMTEFNESGYPVCSEAIPELCRLVYDRIKESSLMVFNGSVPSGVPKEIYRTLIETVKKSGVKTVLDADGELFLEGLKAGPYFIKPNLYEFETAFKMKVQKKQDIVEIARKLIAAQGVGIVCVTMGKDGAVIVNKDQAWFASGSNIEVRGVQGAGDSLVAGICMAIEQRMEIPEMLRYGVAAANASLIREGTLLCTAEDFQKMLPQVSIEKIGS